VNIDRFNAGPGHIELRVDAKFVRGLKLLPETVQSKAMSETGRLLLRYFRGENPDLDRIPVELEHLTAFDRQVYQYSREIPYGQTRTYSEVADGIGRPGAQRAVGQAMGRNEVCIIIPCHRVVAQDGLGGFGSGVSWKRYLLRLESGN